jgi:hypothetical protein
MVVVGVTFVSVVVVVVVTGVVVDFKVVVAGIVVIVMVVVDSVGTYEIGIIRITTSIRIPIKAKMNQFLL